MATNTPGVRPAKSLLLFRPMRQAPRLVPHSPERSGPRPFASRKAWQSQAQARDRPHSRSAGRSRRLPHRDHPRLRHRRRRDGALDASRRARRRCSCVGKLWRGMGDRRRQAAQAQGRPHAQGALRRIAGPCPSQFRQRRHFHLERHHLGRSRAQRRLDRRRPKGIDDLRRDIGGLRPGTRLAEARCRDVLLAEGSRGRGGARNHHSEPACGRTPCDLYAGLAIAEAVSPDQWRQAHRGLFRRRDHQHALDAVRRGLSRRPATGRSRSAASRRSLPAPTPTQRRLRTGSSARRGSISSPARPRHARTPASVSKSWTPRSRL